MDPTKINISKMDFDNAHPLAFYNLDDFSISKYGRMSPTLDQLDSYGKYPHIAINLEKEDIYYIFSMDYTVMKYEISQDTSYVFSSYKPQRMRERTVPVTYNKMPTAESARKYGLDLTRLVGLEIIDDNLLVVWQNATSESYENGRGSPNNLEFFGVVYDLEGIRNPMEVNIPGKLLGTYKDKFLIEENYDLDEYTIGYYKLKIPDALYN